MGWFGFPGGYGHLPERFAVIAIQAEEGTPIAERLGHENAIVPDYRCRIAVLGQGNAPLHVIRRVPADREILLGGNAGAEGSAPGGPIGWSYAEWEQNEQEQ